MLAFQLNVGTLRLRFVKSAEPVGVGQLNHLPLIASPPIALEKGDAFSRRPSPRPGRGFGVEELLEAGEYPHEFAIFA